MKDKSLNDLPVYFDGSTGYGVYTRGCSDYGVDTSITQDSPSILNSFDI